MKEPQNIAVLSTLKLKDLFIVVAACKRFSVNTTAENCVYSDSMQMAFSLLSSLRQFEKHWPCPEERIADVECATFEG
ncbi:uncharacterized protein [Physcomitrium patens]|uniref:uncharacterized protein n=1 Tax=Physcomitrium patens TaxID=3218 RepID=UPI003CCD7C9B